MDAEELAREIRELIDSKTLDAELSEEEGCEVALEAMDACVIEYSMRLEEIRG